MLVVRPGGEAVMSLNRELVAERVPGYARTGVKFARSVQSRDRVLRLAQHGERCADLQVNAPSAGLRLGERAKHVERILRLAAPPQGRAQEQPGVEAGWRRA